MSSKLKYFLLSSFIFFAFFLGIIFYFLEKSWVDFSVLENYNPTKPSIVLNDQGNELFIFQKDKRDPITFEKIPPILIQAFIAAEDWNFFNHHGISLKGIIRSFLVNLYYRKIVQGASTITQQLAKLMFLSSERNFGRKIQEIFLSIQIERNFTKEQILQLYLNNVYFGRGIYGVEAACRRFWDKSIFEITTDQAATLAAVAKSACIYSPLNSPTTSQRRRNTVLNNMQKLGFISKKDCDLFCKTKLLINDHLNGNSTRLYIQEWIRNWMENKYGKEILYKKGFLIKTTINAEKQSYAENIFCKNIAELRKTIDKQLNGGMMAIDSSSGKIKALIGGYNFKESQFNRAFQAIRQIGSTFKPFLYASALKAGFDMDEIFIDEPFELEMPSGEIWRPRNWTHEFEGPMPLVRALITSNNIVSIKLFLKLGAPYVINWAKKFGLKNSLNPFPSLALGTAECNVEEIAAAFNVFANNGSYVQPYLIEWIKDEFGNKIWENEQIGREVLDSKTNSKMVNALMQRIKRSYILLNLEKHIKAEAIGKTGATNESRSAWFVGSTPELTTCVYVGRDDSKPLGQNIFASRIAFPIWLDFNLALDFEKKHFYIDPDLHEITLDWETGQPTANKDPLETVTVLK